ncbi:MAG: hypothetical protein LBN32_00370 [Helicobacteraceae bacterium]|jgi:hypothetical protein|nr:hypothetical protein [Helicobacteraceae bacterium]
MTATELMESVAIVADAANNLNVIQNARNVFRNEMRTADIPAADKIAAIAKWESDFALKIVEMALGAISTLDENTEKANLIRAQIALADAQRELALAQKQTALAQADGFTSNLRVKQAEIFASFAGMAASNNIMTTWIARSMVSAINAINGKTVISNP